MPTQDSRLYLDRQVLIPPVPSWEVLVWTVTRTPTKMLLQDAIPEYTYHLRLERHMYRLDPGNTMPTYTVTKDIVLTHQLISQHVINKVSPFDFEFEDYNCIGRDLPCNFDGDNLVRSSLLAFGINSGNCVELSYDHVRRLAFHAVQKNFSRTIQSHLNALPDDANTESVYWDFLAMGVRPANPNLKWLPRPPGFEEGDVSAEVRQWPSYIAYREGVDKQRNNTPRMDVRLRVIKYRCFRHGQAFRMAVEKQYDFGFLSIPDIYLAWICKDHVGHLRDTATRVPFDIAKGMMKCAEVKKESRPFELTRLFELPCPEVKSDTYRYQTGDTYEDYDGNNRPCVHYFGQIATNTYVPIDH